MTRRLVLLLLSAASLAFAPSASADSWAPPRPLLASSADGTHYVIMNPEATWSEARYTLVRRKAGRAPR